MKQNFEAIPSEFTAQPRWFKVGEDKRPLTKAWSNPENQCRYTDVAGLAGFDTCGHGLGDDYCLLDFDNVIDADGNLSAEAEYYIGSLECDGAYLETSISGRGVHAFLKPTPGKFGKITNSEGKGILWFDKSRNSKLEVFYLSAARYCLFTGNRRSFSNSPPPRILDNKILSGVEADMYLDAILKDIHTQSQADTAPPPKTQDENAEVARSKATYTDTAEYESYRFSQMVKIVPIADLHGDDWLVAMTACKEQGMSYAEFDTINQGGATYNEAENRKRWDSITPTGDWLGALHNLAKRYGYVEAETLSQWRAENPSASAQRHDRPTRQKNSPLVLSDFQRKILFDGDLTDADFADRLAFMFKDEVKFLSEDDIWYLLEGNEFGGTVWKNYGNKKHAVYSYVRRLADFLHANVTQIPATVAGFEVTKEKTAKGLKFGLKPKRQEVEGGNADEAAQKSAFEKLEHIVAAHKKETAIARHLKTRKNVSNAIELLKGIDGVKITQEDLNRNKNLINALNGVIDLETGKLYRPHEKLSFMPTNQLGAIFNPEADTAFVENFFAEVLPDDDTRRAVLRYLGYCLSGTKPYHISEFWRGSGANGKSTILDLLLKVFGTYGLKLPSLALIQSMRPLDANAAQPALASLGGDIRLAIVDELPRGVRLNGELFKQITGDETARARLLHQNLETIELRCKLILNGNHLPAFDMDDKAILRRINTVEFLQTFDADRADPLLPQKLASPENRSALLKILVEEAIHFHAEGLLESAAMADAKSNYVAENNFVADFIEEHLIISEGVGQIPRKELEEKICAAYPRETAHIKKKELFELIRNQLEPLGVDYGKGSKGKNFFKNVKFADGN